jgi:hypothetical protein
MKINRNFIAVLILAPLFMVSCINNDFDTVPEELTNAEIMNQLKIKDLSIWNTLTNQSIDLSSLKSSNLKSGQATQMMDYPEDGKYYFALFEDLYPSEGDYDFNDIIIKSNLKLGGQGSGSFEGILMSELVNKGGSLPVEIGLMFYEVHDEKTYVRIPNENIIVYGNQLEEGGNPWSLPYEKLGKKWEIKFEFKSEANAVWIAYHIVVVRDGGKTRQEILTGGFAKTEVEKFEIPVDHFLTKKGFPWGLEITAKEFAIPNEKKLFLYAYPKFEEWVKSEGNEAKDWFDYPNEEYTHK